MKIRALILWLCLMFNTSQAIATQASLLVFDNTENKQNALPRNFRDLSTLGINAIASGQFSEAQLHEIHKKYPRVCRHIIVK